MFVLSDGDARADLEGVTLVDEPADADVIVLGRRVGRLHLRDDQRGVPAADGRRARWSRCTATCSGGRPTASSSMRARTSIGLEAAAGARGGRLRQAGAPRTSRRRCRCSGSRPNAPRWSGDDVVNDVDGARAAGLHRHPRAHGEVPARRPRTRRRPTTWSIRSPTCPPSWGWLARLRAAMPKVHEAIGFVVVAVFTVGWIWGGGALILKRDPGERFWTWITVEQVLAGGQAAIGVLLLVARLPARHVAPLRLRVRAARASSGSRT